MKARFFVVLAMMFALSATGYGQDADVAGTWEGEMAGRGGGAQPFVLEIEGIGDSITGKLNEAPGLDVLDITDAAVDGNTLTFMTVRAFGENEINVTWTGEIDGDDMSLGRQIEFGGGGGGFGRGGGRGGARGGARGGGGEGGARGGGRGGGRGGIAPVILHRN